MKKLHTPFLFLLYMCFLCIFYHTIIRTQKKDRAGTSFMHSALLITVHFVRSNPFFLFTALNLLIAIIISYLSLFLIHMIFLYPPLFTHFTICSSSSISQLQACLGSPLNHTQVPQEELNVLGTGMIRLSNPASLHCLWNAMAPKWE